MSEKKPEIINSRSLSLKGGSSRDFGGRVREEGHLDNAVQLRRSSFVGHGVRGGRACPDCRVLFTLSAVSCYVWI